MDLTRLLKPLATDTCVSGAATVGLVYGLTHSGALISGLAGLGVICVALGGGAAGRVTAGGYAEGGEMSTMVDDTGTWPGVSSDMPVRVRLLFYGLGLVLWSFAVLGLFSSHLH